MRLSEHEVNNLDKTLQEIEKKSSELSQFKESMGLIVEGVSLSQIFGDESRENQLINVLQRCDTVVCCRLLPLQKAEVVHLIKKRTNKIVLSIGDGQNDVPMIKAANTSAKNEKTTPATVKTCVAAMKPRHFMLPPAIEPT